MSNDIAQYNWRRTENDTLFLDASGDRPAMAVYWLSTKRWCWNTYPGLDKRLPMPEKRQNFSSEADAQRAAERWLRAHFNVADNGGQS